MIPQTWTFPLGGGAISDEFALTFARQREYRLLIVPALFDEANRMRRLTVEVMRRLDAAGIDSVLPDLPGCNDSLLPLASLAPVDWLDAMAVAARHFGATHVLGIRGGGLLTPAGLPCWHYAPVKGASVVRQMVRARILASREAGREENHDDLLAQARDEGAELAGYSLSADFIRQFESLAPQSESVSRIDQDMVGGSGLWLRAEPGESRAQADALAAILAIGMKA